MKKSKSPPLNLAPAPGGAASRRSAWVADTRGSLFLTGLIWFAVVFALILPSLLNSGAADSGIGHANSFTRTIKLILLTCGVVVIFRRRLLAFAVLRFLNPFLIAFLVLVPLSIVWSIDAGATIARYVSLASFVAMCFALVVKSWHPKRFQQLLRPLLTTILVASILFGIAYPDLAIEHGLGTLDNAWRGLTSQKNEFGMLGSLAFILWFHAFLARESTWWGALAGCGIAAICVLLSRSSTSLFATAFAATLMLMLLRSPYNLRRYMPWIVGTFAAAVVMYAVAVLNVVPGLDVILSPFAALSGKDLTFSARSQIWAIIKEHVQLSPYFGSGYGAYWTGEVPTSPSYIFLSRMYFYPSESHNGYLEIVNDLGFVGLACLLGYLVSYVRQALRLLKIDRNQAVLYLCFFFQQAMANLSESSWLSANVPLVFIIMTLATFCLARALVDYRWRQHFSSFDASTQTRAMNAV
jgi:exopolysaccharide production protein ExoQ